MDSKNKYKDKIEELVADRQKFIDFVYTSPEDAVKELKRRWHDESIKVPISIPPIFEKGFKAVLHRQLITPNYEVLRFLSIADGLDFDPIFFEYTKDKFVTENEWKYHLGCLHFYLGHGKKGGIKLDRSNIIDFNKSNGKKLSDVKTIWNQSLVDFHHELFLKRFPKLNPKLFDGSDWYSKNGGCAKDYYKNFFLLFIKHGILFENFMLDTKEMSFSKEVFLPAFIEVKEKTGLKPLIVALEPTEIEEDIFWMCYPPEEVVRSVKKKTGKAAGE